MEAEPLQWAEPVERSEAVEWAALGTDLRNSVK